MRSSPSIAQAVATRTTGLSPMRFSRYSSTMSMVSVYSPEPARTSGPMVCSGTVLLLASGVLRVALLTEGGAAFYGVIAAAISHVQLALVVGVGFGFE